MDAYEKSQNAAQPSRKPWTVPAWAAIVLAALLLAALGWRQFSVISAGAQFDSERDALVEKLNAEKAAALMRARGALARETDEAFRLFGTALSWTVRSAMLRNNRDEIDQYFTQLVKHDRIRLALLAGPDGKITLASDRNYQEAAFGEHFPAALLQENVVTLHPGEGALKRLVIPVHGLSSRLGTVLVVYEAPTLPAS